MLQFMFEHVKINVLLKTWTWRRCLRPYFSMMMMSISPHFTRSNFLTPWPLANAEGQA